VAKKGELSEKRLPRTLWENYHWNTFKFEVLKALYHSMRDYGLSGLTITQLAQAISNEINRKVSYSQTYESVANLNKNRYVKKYKTPEGNSYTLYQKGREYYGMMVDRKLMRDTTGLSVNLFLVRWPPSNVVALHKWVKKELNNNGKHKLSSKNRVKVCEKLRHEYFEEKPHQLKSYLEYVKDVSPYLCLIEKYGIEI